MTTRTDLPPKHWLAGIPLNPLSVANKLLPPLPGFPYLSEGNVAVIAGPTGGGRSALVELGLYEAALAGLRCAYFGAEIDSGEFAARARMIADMLSEA